MSYFEEVVEINPNNSDAWGNIGILFRMAKKYDKALSYLRKALEINPQD